MRIFKVIGLAAFLAAGCASMPKPTEEIANAQAAMRGAEEVGAPAVPAAALALKLAEDELASARKLAEDGEHAEARSMALRATNDAELALALARLAQARDRAAKATATPTPVSATDLH